MHDDSPLSWYTKPKNDNLNISMFILFDLLRNIENIGKKCS